MITFSLLPNLVALFLGLSLFWLCALTRLLNKGLHKKLVIYFAIFVGSLWGLAIASVLWVLQVPS